MKILQSRSFQVGSALILIGLAGCMYFSIADQSDPDYAPPRYVVASMVAGWVVVTGAATVLFSLMSNSLGPSTCRWAGVSIGLLGILKLFTFEIGSLEVWRTSRTGTITFDLVAVTAFVLGGVLVSMAGTSQEPQAEQCAEPNP